MFTPQEVSEKTFPKTSALTAGYNMAAVDEFLDPLTEDYTALYKENAALKAKLKVLAEKIEEYRSTEDAMRTTLVTAQKLATKLVLTAHPFEHTLVALMQPPRPARRGEQVHVLRLPPVGDERDDPAVAPVSERQTRLLQRLAQDALLRALAVLKLAAHADPLVAVAVVLLFHTVEHQIVPALVFNVAERRVFHLSASRNTISS